jgi:antitoxin component YwqK of YwqJK toxin-antitoxin module
MKTYTTIGRLVLLAILTLCVSSLNAQQASKKWGKVTCHYENGEKSSRGRVDQFGRSGMWKFWDEEGQLHHTAVFFHDTLNGRYTEYNKCKDVVVEGQYERGYKDGVWRFYNDEGKMVSENTFDNGKLHGRQVTWYENGDVREMLVCENDMIVTRKAWYPGGRIRTVESYKNGLNEGTWYTYPEPFNEDDTFPSASDQYVDGKLHGWHYAFLDGKKVEEIHYTDGETDGTCSRWDDHGHLLSEESFVKGQRNGVCTYYDCSRVLRTITYKNGELHGAKNDYDRTGNLILTTWYTAGYRDSVKTYHNNGTVATRRVYAIGSSGLESSEYTEWNEDGVKLLYGRYLGEQKYGEWYTYYPDGKKRSLTTYVDGVVNGPYTRWYANGNGRIYCGGRRIAHFCSRVE